MNRVVVRFLGGIVIVAIFFGLVISPLIYENFTRIDVVKINKQVMELNRKKVQCEKDLPRGEFCIIEVRKPDDIMGGEK